MGNVSPRSFFNRSSLIKGVVCPFLVSQLNQNYVVPDRRLFYFSSDLINLDSILKERGFKPLSFFISQRMSM